MNNKLLVKRPYTAPLALMDYGPTSIDLFIFESNAPHRMYRMYGTYICYESTIGSSNVEPNSVEREKIEE